MFNRLLQSLVENPLVCAFNLLSQDFITIKLLLLEYFNDSHQGQQVILKDIEEGIASNLAYQAIDVKTLNVCLGSLLVIIDFKHFPEVQTRVACVEQAIKFSLWLFSSNDIFVPDETE